VGALGLGVVGSALATVAAQVLSCVLAWLGLARGRYSLTPRSAMPRARTALSICSVGLGQFLVQFANFSLFLVMNGCVQGYAGGAGVAAIGIVNTLGGFFCMPAIGLIQGAMPLFGYYKGSGERGKTAAVYRRILLLGSLFLAACTLLCEAAPGPLLRAFTADSVLVAFCARALRVAMAALPATMIAQTAALYFMATGDGLKGGVLVLTRPLLMVALMLGMSKAWGLTGLLWAMPATDLAIVAAAALIMPRDILRGPARGPRAPFASPSEALQSEVV
jgi:Na+-driven multidrug efflux pump